MKKYKGSGKSVKRPSISVKRPSISPVKSSSSRPLTRGYINTLKKRPPKRYCKHGWIWSNDEQTHYINHRDDYPRGNTIEERCGKFYTPEEIAQMKSEITEAECSICDEEITEPLTECIMCENLHSFHHKCLLTWWKSNTSSQLRCPSCNIEIKWKICKTTKDLHSGGKQKYSKLKKSIRNRRNRK